MAFDKIKKAVSSSSSKSKNKPTNPKLYAQVKAATKKKFNRWPSAYGSAWLVKEYKRRGGGYK